MRWRSCAPPRRGLRISAADRSYLSPARPAGTPHPLQQVQRRRLACIEARGAGAPSQRRGHAELSALSLIEYFCLNPASYTAGVCLLSRLTQLMALALQPLVERSATMEPFIRAVKQLTGRRELYVGANMSSRSQCTVGALCLACARRPSSGRASAARVYSIGSGEPQRAWPERKRLHMHTYARLDLARLPRRPE